MTRRFALVLAILVSTGSWAQTPVRAKVFPGAQALPMMAGVQQGIFERHGIKLELLFTTTSQEQRDGLASGDFQVAHAAVDNAVAMVERARHDVIIVTGGDSSMNEFFVQPDVRSIADLKGRTVIVDAPNTAYALQAKKILRMNGLKDTDYTVKTVGGTLFRYRAMREDKSHAASMLNPPFSIDAPGAGLKSLGRAVDLIGPYQATGAWVLRKWASATTPRRSSATSPPSSSRRAGRWRRRTRTRRRRCSPSASSCSPRSPRAPGTCSPIRNSASRATAGSTRRASATCSRCAPRSRATGAARRRRSTSSSTSASMTRR